MPPQHLHNNTEAITGPTRTFLDGHWGKGHMRGGVVLSGLGGQGWGDDGHNGNGAWRSDEVAWASYARNCIAPTVARPLWGSLLPRSSSRLPRNPSMALSTGSDLVLQKITNFCLSRLRCFASCPSEARTWKPIQGY